MGARVLGVIETLHAFVLVGLPSLAEAMVVAAYATLPCLTTA